MILNEISTLNIDYPEYDGPYKRQALDYAPDSIWNIRSAHDCHQSPNHALSPWPPQHRPHSTYTRKQIPSSGQCVDQSLASLCQYDHTSRTHVEYHAPRFENSDRTHQSLGRGWDSSGGNKAMASDCANLTGICVYGRDCHVYVYRDCHVYVRAILSDVAMAATWICDGDYV